MAEHWDNWETPIKDALIEAAAITASLWMVLIEIQDDRTEPDPEHVRDSLDSVEAAIEELQRIRLHLINDSDAVRGAR